MRKIESILATTFVVSGCLIPPTVDIQAGSSATQPVSASPEQTPPENPAPVLDKEFLEEIQGITIQGTEEARGDAYSALHLLRARTDEHYRYVTRNLAGTLVVLDIVGGSSETFVFEDPIRVAFDRKTREAGIIWFAGGFVHEACHVRQFLRYRENFPGTPIPIETIRETECLRIEYEALVLLGADQQTLDYVKKQEDESRKRE